ncbi:MAG: hypothetical protein GX897_06000 [Clostridiales bacterium]|nr:hypothetical protein [Clostridiales bacterium]
MSEYTFYSSFPGSRPVISDEKTRRFAHESLLGKYGRETSLTPCVSLDGIAGFEKLSSYEKYDAAVNEIVRRCPIRFTPNELLCGSATLGDAVGARLPASFKGEYPLSGINHLTSGFERAVKEGIDSYETRIDKRLSDDGLDSNQISMLTSMKNTISAMRIWHGRYLCEIKANIENTSGDEQKYWRELYENLEPVPFKAPSSFRQAIQSLWFCFAFLRLLGNWPGIGRIDLILDPYYKADLKAGKITYDEARTLICHFMIKGCEWIRLEGRGSGDAQHYQNIVLCGDDDEGNEFISDISYMVLSVTEEFPIPDFPIAVRMRDDSPQELYEAIARVMRHGSGVAAIYNNDLVVDSMVKFGYSLSEARNFANDGCWEVQVPGKTCFTYCPIDIFPLLQDKTLNIGGEEYPDFPDFESLYETFREAMAVQVKEWNDGADNFARWDMPMSAISLFTDGCIETGLGYYNRGAVYTAYSLHYGGVPDLCDCLYAIKKLVYDEKLVTLPKLCRILHNDWQPEDDSDEAEVEFVSALRARARSLEYYGNDNPECDEIIGRIVRDFTDEMAKTKERSGVLRPAGLSTFGRQIEWAKNRLAGADGHGKHYIRANNIAPTPGTDVKGASAVIKSACNIDFSALASGAALDLKLDPGSVKGEDGINALVGLMKAFIRLGGFFLQIDVADAAALIDAKLHPEKYPNLAVRISGWSARFVTLDEHWQDMIIGRTSQNRM